MVIRERKVKRRLDPLIMDILRAEGDRAELVIELRTNDNNNRTYSKPRKLPLWRINRPPWRFKD
jgi:hypothetical protein